MKDLYKDLFNRAPVAILELDYSPMLALKRKIGSRKSAVIRSYLLENAKALKETFGKIRILNINHGALKFYNVSSKKAFLNALLRSFTGRAFDLLVEQFVVIFSGGRDFSGEMKCKVGRSQIQDIFLRLIVQGKAGQGYSSVIMTLQDITAWKKREQHLLMKAQKDGLTNLMNQSAMLERVDAELIRAKRYGLELSCMMIDLDFFKVINDKFGHQKGDRILKEVAGMISKCFRKVDVVGRYGGDEFIVLLPETTAKNAYYAASRLQKIFANKLFKYRNVITFHITLSIGIAGYSGKNTKIRNAQDLIALADNEMYNCKKAGRNRISVSKL